MRSRNGVKGRAAALALLVVVAAGVVTRGTWLSAVGASLVCREGVGAVDAILVENFEPNYLVFERAAMLQFSGVAARVVVPADAWRDGEMNPVSRAITELMARLARVQSPEIIPIREEEPYTLNAAYQVRDFLVRTDVRSVVLVAPAFRSRRSSLAYAAALDAADIRLYCVPVYGQYTAANWTTRWHGIQVVTEQFLKLQFYRWYVLRRGGAPRAAPE